VPKHPQPRHPPTAPPAHATVVLVDREALYRWFVAESLRGSGVDVVPCQSLDEAASALREAIAPDLLIVDSDMLEGRAVETLRGVRAEAAATPCLILDSGGDVSLSRLGAVTVAAKPVDTAAVITLVTSQLHRDLPAA
jgi:DNA-binding NtrC family response regulator